MIFWASVCRKAPSRGHKMNGITQHLDVPTMAFLVTLLFASLSAVMACTYFFRRTYPGFGSMTLAQIVWSAGLFLNFYRFLGEFASLYLGSLLMLLYAVLIFRGLAQYGGVAGKKRLAVNALAFAAAASLMAYYLFVDYNTCARIVVFSAFMGFFFSRISIEPYVSRTWRRHATQSVFSALYLMLAVAFWARAYNAWGAQNCLPSGPDALAKLLLMGAVLVTPLLVFCIIAMTSARLEAELNRANRELREASETDALTGLANRRKFDAVYEKEWQRTADQANPLAVVILDVDDFKKYNDRYGHQAGDECLKRVAMVLRASVRRSGELAARYGGEEFALVLPGLSSAEAFDLAQDIRREVESLGIEHEASRHASVVCVSAGVAARMPRCNEAMSALLHEADVALYRAKAQGKNTVVMTA